MDIDLDACIRGDKRAWDAFVDRWAGVIHAAVQRAFHGGRGAAARVEVEDTVQDVFLRLVKDDCRLLRSYDAQRASLSTWLTLVARSTAIDGLRRRRPPPAMPLEPGDAVQAPTETSASLPEIPLHLLSARQRLVLTLLFDEERSVAEAAVLIGVDEQTIRSTKHKALTRLREHLKKGTDPF
jgi:RNA polymerase sigma-70 factor (ECF subfamily)